MENLKRTSKLYPIKQKYAHIKYSAFEVVWILFFSPHKLEDKTLILEKTDKPNQLYANMHQ